MQQLQAFLGGIARSDSAVLVSGETGTEKQLVAETIHASSRRAAAPFVAVELAALPPSSQRDALFGAVHPDGSVSPGAFDRADGGTLYLDEIGALAPALQGEVLHALDRREVESRGAAGFRPVDVRVIASTNHDLEAEVHAGSFRADLFHRLAAVSVTAPPLRERREDVALLAEGIVRDFARAQGRAAPALSPEAVDLLLQYDWPGNVRELRGVLQRAMSTEPGAQTLTWELLRITPAPSSSGTRRLQPEFRTFKEAKDLLLDQWEVEYLKGVLNRAGGNMTLAARYAGIARGHLYRLLKKHGMVRSGTA